MYFCCRVEGFDPTVVQLRGELDIATAPSLCECLSQVEGDVEIDCSRLDFIDAAGLTALVSAHLACRERGVRFVLSNPSPLLMRLLRITDLDEIFETLGGGISHGVA